VLTGKTQLLAVEILHAHYELLAKEEILLQHAHG